MILLAGDIGGTKIRLASYKSTGSDLIRENTERFDSRSAPSLGAIVSSYLKNHDLNPTAACFGIPGPVVNGEVKTTNLPWHLSESELVKSLGIPKVRLVNDLVSTVASIPHLKQTDLIELNPGNRAGARKVFGIVAPGTGLGQAGLVESNGHFEVLPSEGGHSDFAPTSEIEVDLYKYLANRFGRVSYERVLSGPGVYNIYQFLKDSHLEIEPDELRVRISKGDPGAIISESALKSEHPICEKTLEIFAHILGAQAGNLALTYLATGGIYLGGGIPPKIADKLTDGNTVTSYLNKGRLSSIVEATPLYIIKDDHAALLGAAHLASKL